MIKDIKPNELFSSQKYIKDIQNLIKQNIKKGEIRIDHEKIMYKALPKPQMPNLHMKSMIQNNNTYA